jgi:hypothetical protein
MLTLFGTHTYIDTHVDICASDLCERWTRKGKSGETLSKGVW